VPEYRRSSEAVKTMIADGRITGGITVPDIERLTGTSYATARAVAKRLEDEGILQSHPGKGYAVVAMPQEAAARRASAEELSEQLIQLRAEVHELAERLGTSGEFSERLERLESNLEDLYDKLGYEYSADGNGERGENPAPAARRGRTG
jgi:DNA-binding GntR family transcriptional regulator